MAVDEELNQRFRNALLGLEGVSERNMMSGTCFMLNGHVVGGAHRDKSGAGWFMFRVGKQNEAAAEKIGHGQIMTHGDRRMSGLYYVAEEESADSIFNAWKSLAIAHAYSLPPK